MRKLCSLQENAQKKQLRLFSNFLRKKKKKKSTVFEGDYSELALSFQIITEIKKSTVLEGTISGGSGGARAYTFFRGGLGGL